ncbi:tetratricopeptide repeat protein [Fischerella sp. JS2]|uniref:tetratricopeptide repeat protein n=1 Tax=Fischerella sp. JS2 TaxID=2597771 RepID=UPI0028EC1161|nr:tetratricopeptide repeat protein [Fischerella sp. JS2]
MGKGFGIKKQKHGEKDYKAYVDLLCKILKIISQHPNNLEKAVYPLLEGNLDKLNDYFAEVLRRWAKVKLSEDFKQAYNTADAILGFINLLKNFRQVDTASCIEISIAGNEVVLVFVRSPCFSKTIWANIQHNLGNCYMKRIQGEREENLEKAINCLKKELEIHTQNHHPQEWLKVKNDLGVAYSDRIQGKHSENIKQALHHFTEALQAFPHDSFPEHLGRLSHNLTFVLREEIFSKGNYLPEGTQQLICNFTEDLQEFIQKCEPEKWANIQRHLGDFYDANHQGDRAKNLEQAIYFYAKALQVFTQEKCPEGWATIQQHQGNSYLRRI